MDPLPSPIKQQQNQTKPKKTISVDQEVVVKVIYVIFYIYSP